MLGSGIVTIAPDLSGPKQESLSSHTGYQVHITLRMHLTNPGLPWLHLLQQQHLEHIASAVSQAGEERAGNIVVQLLSASVWKEHIASPHIPLGKTSHLAAPDF